LTVTFNDLFLWTEYVAICQISLALSVTSDDFFNFRIVDLKTVKMKKQTFPDSVVLKKRIGAILLTLTKYHKFVLVVVPHMLQVHSTIFLQRILISLIRIKILFQKLKV
jgi:hypothetical protein